MPIISVSTGTNNAYPVSCEGTTVGIAAAFAVNNPDDIVIGKRHKSIHIKKKMI